MMSQWIDLGEAASVLGVNQATVRRRIGKGQLQSRRGEGDRLQVRMDFTGEAAALFEAADRLLDEGLRDRARALALDAAARHASASGEADAEETTPAAPPADTPVEADEAGDEAPQLASNPWLMNTRRATTQEGLVLDRRRARIAPGLLLGRAQADAERTGETDLTRYQRLAGACLVLAQDQTDLAERRAEAGARESARLRRVCGASWAASALIAVVLTGVGVKLGFDASFARGEAAAQAALAQNERQSVDRARAELATLRRASGHETMAEVQDWGR